MLAVHAVAAVRERAQGQRLGVAVQAELIVSKPLQSLLQQNAVQRGGEGCRRVATAAA